VGQVKMILFGFSALMMELAEIKLVLRATVSKNPPLIRTIVTIEAAT
jgi:hypothetical protein